MVRKWRWRASVWPGLVCVLWGQFSSASELVSLYGRVCDPSGFPLAASIVRVFAGADSLVVATQCNGSGAFSMSLSPGSYRLIVSRLDRLTSERPLTVAAKPQALSIVLHEEPLYLPPVRVAAPRHAPDRSLSGFSIDPDDLKNQVGGFEDVMRTVQTLPGVSAPSDLQAEFFVRGSHAAANAVYLDGVEIMFPYHILGFNSVFSPGLVQSAKFYNANPPAEYSSASGGVLVVQSRGSHLQAPSTDVGLSWLSGHVHSTVGNAERSAAFSMRRSYHDKLVQMLGSVPNQQIPNFHEVHLRGRWVPKKGHEVIAGFLRAGDGMSIPSPELQAQNYALIQSEGGENSDDDLRQSSLDARGGRLRVNNTLQVFSLQHNSTPAPDVYLQTSFAWVPQDFHFSLNAHDRESATVHSRVATIRQSARWHGRRQRLHFGWRLYRDFTERRVSAHAGLLQLRHADTSVHLRDQAERYDFHRSRRRGSAMLHVSHILIPQRLPVEFESGLRFEHDTLTGEILRDPQLAATWKYHEGWRLRFAWGRTHTLRDKFVEIAPSRDGAPLRSEVATTSTLGVQGKSGPWSLGITGWRKRQSNVVYEAQPALYANGAVVKGRGVDGWCEWRTASGWTNRLQYSWMHSLQRNPIMFRRNVLPGVSASAPRRALFEAPYWFSPVQDLRHQLSWSLGLKRGVWEFGSQLRWQSGRPWTPVATVLPDSRGRPVGVEGRRNSARLPAYFRLDARVARTFRSSRFRWNVYAEVLNLTRSRNVFQYRYDPPYEDRLGIMMLPALPTLGFEAHF